MKPIKYFLVVSLFLFVQLLRNESFSQSDEARFNAVTIEDENLFPETATSIQNLVDYTGKPITTRIVLHPDKADIYNPTQSDILAASNLHPISRTMGEILDSYYWAWPSWEPCIQNITRK